MEIIKRKELTTSKWSGGSTTQLYIYPAHSNYQKLNFDFRISTAKVDVAESVFTKLPGISRQLMILKGETRLTYQQKDSVLLHKFDVTQFEGDWETTSRGVVTDFNLMMTHNYQGDISHLSCKSGDFQIIEAECVGDFLAIYAYRGMVSIGINKKSELINTGDVLILNKKENWGKVTVNALEESSLILCQVNRIK